MTILTFTGFQSNKPDFGKLCDIDTNGDLIKKTNLNFYYGIYDTKRIDHLKLAEFLRNTNTSTYFTVGTNRELASGICPYDARRLQDTFVNTKDPGVLVIDIDNAHKFNIYSFDDCNKSLTEVDSQFALIMKSMTSSASSYVSYNGNDSGLKGIHVWIPIDSTLNNGEILHTLHVRSVNKGFAYPHITKTGTVIIKSIVDTALKLSNQPILEGGAISKHPDIVCNYKVQEYAGEILKSDAISPLSKEELALFEKNTAKLKSTVKNQAEKIKKEYYESENHQVKLKIPGISNFIANKIVKDAVENQILHGEHSIMLEDETVITVQDICDNEKTYHGVHCRHPLDSSISWKSIIYSDQEIKIIHTFAHGGENFKLCSNINGSMQNKEIELLEHVDNFNLQYANTTVGGKHVILKFNGREHEYFSADTLRKVYNNSKIQVGKKYVRDKLKPIFKNHFDAWFDHPNSRVYKDGVVFKPNADVPDTVFNLWTGFAVDPNPGADISRIKYHIEYIICQNDTNLIKYFYDWIAYMFQHPDRPARSAIIIKGKKGSGKGALGHFLRNIFGKHAIHISSEQHLTGKFNHHLMNCCFIFSDEAFYRNDKANESTLKTLITEPVIMIERKGADAIQQPNYLKVLMTTNNEYTVPTSSDERRFAVYKISDEKIGNTEYFNALHESLHDLSVQASFLHEMLNRDISNYSPSSIPDSVGLMEEKYHSLKSSAKFLVDVFTIGGFGSDVKWFTEVKSCDLFEYYLSWCDKSKVSRYEMDNLTTFSKYIRQMFKEGKRQNKNRTVNLGDIDSAKERFEMHEKINLSLINI